MARLESPDADAGIRTIITPSQSSYFAGEPFSVTITFINTRSPSAGPSRPPLHGHRRGAHSISSAPLARPPTSPGIPRTPIIPLVARTRSHDAHVPSRKGLVGKTTTVSDSSASAMIAGPGKGGGADVSLSSLVEQRRRRLLGGKSLSVSIAPPDFDEAGPLTSLLEPSANSALGSFNDARHGAGSVYPSLTSVSSPVPSSLAGPSPLPRTDALPLSQHHPHARKQSVLDGGDLPFDLPFMTPNASTSSFSLALDPIAEASLSAAASYPSTPTLGSPYMEPGSPSRFPGSIRPLPQDASNLVPAYPQPRSPSRAPYIGLGHPSSSYYGRPQPPKTAAASSFPSSSPFSLPNNTELVLYSYAQLTGSVTITPVAGTTPTPEQREALWGVRAALRKRTVVGGGSMDINSEMHHRVSSSGSGGGVRATQQHGRSASLTAGLFSMIGALSSPLMSASSSSASSSWMGSSRWRSESSSIPPRPHNGSSPNLGVGLGLGFPGGTSAGTVRKRSGSAGGNLSGSRSGSGGGYGYGYANLGEPVDAEAPLPTFEVQPAMLAVDLSLLPGESRSYTYTVVLPDNLPPTFRGKSLRFSYELVVGLCRAGPPSSAGSNNISKVMKVPIRVYNNVAVGRPPKPYNLLWPVDKRMDLAMPRSQAKVTELVGGRDAVKRPASLVASHAASAREGGSLEDFVAYARRLLDSLPVPSPSKSGEDGEGVVRNGDEARDVDVGPSADLELRRASATALRQELDKEREDAAEGALDGCREAVEILTRTPKKASYDVTKDGVKVAVLTFPKSSYRLGETITGVVELNERKGRARVLQLSAFLEAQESLPSSISPLSARRQLRRAYGAHYSAFLLNTLRTTFSLDIPSDASPAFQTCVGTPRLGTPADQYGGVEWKVRLCLLVALASESADAGTEGVRFKSLARDGPRGEWGSSWKALEVMAALEKPSSGTAAPAAQSGGSAQSPSALSPLPVQPSSASSWASFFSSYLSGDDEREYHDGDELFDDDGFGGGGGGAASAYDGIKPDLGGGVGVGVDFAGGEEGLWKDVRLETVECEVPIRVWPGNTAFKAVDVMFEV